MSWYGTHPSPTVTVELARSFIPRACRSCVYQIRLILSGVRRWLGAAPCYRCGAVFSDDTIERLAYWKRTGDESVLADLAPGYGRPDDAHPKE